MRFAALVCLATCVIFTDLHAEGRQPPDLASRARGAEQVVLATIVAVNAAFAKNAHGDQIIVSQVQLQVEETLKGSGRDFALLVDVEGGTVGDLTLNVSDMPSVTAGERAVFFLNRNSNGKLVPHLRGFGIIKLNERDQAPGSSLTLETIRTDVQRGRQ